MGYVGEIIMSDIVWSPACHFSECMFWRPVIELHGDETLFTISIILFYKLSSWTFDLKAAYTINYLSSKFQKQCTEL